MMRAECILSAALFFLVPTYARGDTPRTDCPVKGKATLVPASDELVQENQMADKCHLSRIATFEHLQWFIAEGLLVPVDRLDIIEAELGEEDPDNSERYAYARPWAVKFLDETAKKAEAAGFLIQVTSLVRPADYQKRLRRHNDNAVSDSTHSTGSTVDISLSGLSWKHKNWLRQYMLQLEREGKVEATEERDNLCLHVFIHPSYAVETVVPAQTGPPSP